MTVSLEKGLKTLVFGRGVILSSIEADGLKFGEDFSTLRCESLTPKERRVHIEGYIIATGNAPSVRRKETERRRRILSAITYPGERFILRVDDKYAEMTDGELIIKRTAPFSGGEAEHFVLTATICDGLFHKSANKLQLSRQTEGAYFPGAVTDAVSVGQLGRSSFVSVNNGGDVPVGFVGQFTADRATTSFVLTNTSTKRSLEARFAFGAGDTVKVSTVKDDPYFKVTRNGTDINLTGVATEASELFLLYPGETVLTLGNGVLYSGNVTFTEAYVSF